MTRPNHALTAQLLTLGSGPSTMAPLLPSLSQPALMTSLGVLQNLLTEEGKTWAQFTAGAA